MALAFIVAMWPSKKDQDHQPYLKSGQLKKFKEIPIKPFEIPYPLEQSHIFKTVEEVKQPISAQNSSGNIPHWLKGKKSNLNIK